MISEKMRKLTENNSVIRAMFEEGKRQAALYGAENVYDFSLGNPSVPAPDSVREAAIDILQHEDPLMLHGYMSNVGYEDVRGTVADSLNRRFGGDFTAQDITMTVGAAGGLNVILKALLNPGDEVVSFAPYFTEYDNYVGNYDGKLVVVPPDFESFQPNLEAFAGLLNEKTRAVIINNPNNPTGVVYSAETIQAMAAILEEKQQAFGTSIYIISDEPYRELVYDGVQVPWLPAFYRNTIVGYSWSKSLSLPGERIGYLAVPKQIDDYENVNAAVGIATRVLGFVNAPSLMQRVVARCLEEKTDVAAYDRNRQTLYNGLKELGFSCIRPQGAFYLFVRSPVPDEKEFVAKAKEYHLLLVPGSSFAGPGHVRISYCVSYETIVNSLPAFRKLAQDYGLC